MFDLSLWTKKWQQFFLFPQLSFCNSRWRILCMNTKAEGLIHAPWFLFICQCACEYFLVQVREAEQYVQECILFIRCASWSIKLRFMVFLPWFWIPSFFHSAGVWWSKLKMSLHLWVRQCSPLSYNLFFRKKFVTATLLWSVMGPWSK